MILHLFETDRFADLAIDKFEAAAPGNNLYIIDSNKPTEELSLLKHKELGRACDLNQIWRDINSLHSFEFVVLHGLSHNMVRIVAKAPPEIKFVWALWGGEVYCRTPEFYDHSNIANTEAEHLRQEFEWLQRKEHGPFSHNNYPALRLAFSKIKLNICALEDELRLFKSRMPYLNAGWAQWSYNTLPDHYDKPNGINIILGNSASPMNNHIPMLELLSRHDLTGRQVIVPLSYGDMTYARQVIQVGKQLLGDHFHPLTDFMELDAYRELMLTCNIMIMNHIQERGFGTLMMALNNGISAVLRPDSVIYNILKPLNLKIFSTAELADQKRFDQIAMTSADIGHNRSILKALLSFDAIVQQTRVIIRQVNEMA